MWRVLRRPRWLLYLALALVFGVVAAWLGSWQLDRHEQRVERRDIIETNYFADPRPLSEVLPPGEALSPGQEWARVVAQGRYEQDHQHVVRNRPHQGVYGYEVLVPLDVGDGRELTVNRGWVPNAPVADELPEIPPAPTGEVEVTGWLRSSETDLDRDMPVGQLASIDLPRLQDATGLDLADAYLVLEQEAPAPAESPAGLVPPDTGVGVHFAYALQWWLTAPFGLVLVLFMARRQAQEEARAEGTTGDRPRRPRKRRIWDEEDWDAEDVGRQAQSRNWVSYSER